MVSFPSDSDETSGMARCRKQKRLCLLHKRQRRVNPLRYHSYLPACRVRPAPQCASNNARLLITEACRPGLHKAHTLFSPKARRGSSHGVRALPCIHRQLSAALRSGTCSRHSRIFHCPQYSPFGVGSQGRRAVQFFTCKASQSKNIHLTIK